MRDHHHRLGGMRRHALGEERQRALLRLEQGLAVRQAHAGWLCGPCLQAAWELGGDLSATLTRPRAGIDLTQPLVGGNCQVMQFCQLGRGVDGAPQVAAVHGRDWLVRQRSRQLAGLRQPPLGQPRVGLALPPALDVENRLAMARKQNTNRCSSRHLRQYRPAGGLRGST